MTKQIDIQQKIQTLQSSLQEQIQAIQEALDIQQQNAGVVKKVGEKEILRSLRESHAERYPIGNAALQKVDERMVSLYFRMLAVILTQEEANPAQIHFYRRLAAPFTEETSAEEYMRQGMDVELQDYTDFVGVYKGNPLKYRFLLDALILIALGTKRGNQLVLIAQLMESLGIQSEEARYISALSRGIVEKNSDQCEEVEKRCPASIDANLFGEYKKVLSTKVTMRYGGQVLLDGGQAKSDFDTELSLEIPKSRLVLKNYRIQTKKRPIQIKGYEQVIIENCEFSGGDQFNPFIRIENCQDVTLLNCEFRRSSKPIQIISANHAQISNCRFYDFMDRTLVFVNTDSVLIENSEFQNCCYEYNGSWHMEWTIPSEEYEHFDCDRGKNYLVGGVILIAKNHISDGKRDIDDGLFSRMLHQGQEEPQQFNWKCENMNIVGTVFRNCKTRTSDNNMHRPSGIIANRPVTVTNCEFSNCRGYIKDTQDRTEYLSLFPSGSKDENNTIVRSAPF